MLNNNLNGTIEKLANRKNLEFSVENYKALSSSAFLVTVSHDTVHDYTQQDFQQAIAKTFDNKLALVKNSVTSGLINGYKKISKFIVSQNPQIKSYNTVNLANFKVVTANVFQDDEGQIWKAMGEGSSRRLVLTSKDDLAAILESRTRRTSVASFLGTNENLKAGDYVMYYNPMSNSVCSGFIFDTKEDLDIFNREEQIATKVVAECVLASVPAENIPFQEISKITIDESKGITEYMKKLYEGTEFFTKMEQQIREKALVPEMVETKSY